MKMFLTRLGLRLARWSSPATSPRSTCRAARSPGCAIVQDILDGVDDVHFSELTSHDVVRHRLVSAIVDAYGRWDAASNGQPRRRARLAGRAPGRRDGRDGRAAVSIEVINETERRASTRRELVDLRPLRARRRCGSTRRPSCPSMLVDEAAMERLHVQWMDLPGPDRRDELPDGRAAPGPRRRGARARAARRHRAVPERRRAAGRARPGTPPRRSCCCSPRTASCTCSATTTPSRTRSARCSSLQRTLLLTFLAGRGNGPAG